MSQYEVLMTTIDHAKRKKFSFPLGRFFRWFFWISYKRIDFFQYFSIKELNIMTLNDVLGLTLSLLIKIKSQKSILIKLFRFFGEFLDFKKWNSHQKNQKLSKYKNYSIYIHFTNYKRHFAVSIKAINYTN